LIMNHYRSQPSIARFLVPIGALLCLPALIWLWDAMLARSASVGLDPGLFLLGLEFFLVLLLAGVLLYLCRCAWGIHYALDKDTLTIYCGGVRRVLPVASIVAVYEPGEAVRGRSVVVRWRGVPPFVPGYVAGSGVSEQVGRVLSIATVPIHRQVLVKTASVTLGVSPVDPGGFIAQLEDARSTADELDGGADTAARTTLTGLAAWGSPLWSDRLTRSLLVAGLVLNILLFGYLSLVYSDLPMRLPLHWNAQAQIDRIGTPAELLRLPVFATGIWLVNVVLALWTSRREPAVRLFLLAGAVAAQVVFWAGALSIVLRTV
jgi:hypothetical protein